MKKKFKILPLKNSLARCLVDAADFDWLMRKTWKLHSGYVVEASSSGLRLHNHITGSIGSDHRDRNRLNNRRSNLRPCTNAQNSYNKSKKKGPSKSKYKGVTIDRGSWRARIRHNGILIELGHWRTEAEAAKAYDAAAAMLFQEFAAPNNTDANPYPSVTPKQLRMIAARNNRHRFRKRFEGVCLVSCKCKLKKPWRAYLTVGQKQIHIGVFRTKKEALAARSLRISEMVQDK